MSRDERSPRLAALVTTVSGTVRDVTAELLRRAPEQPDLLARFQTMVDDVFAHWEDLEREAGESRVAAERASADAEADIAEADARVAEYVEAVERIRAEEGAQSERDFEARVADVIARAEASETAHRERHETLERERNALATALSAMAAAVDRAARAETADHARLEDGLALAAGGLEATPRGQGSGAGDG